MSSDQLARRIAGAYGTRTGALLCSVLMTFQNHNPGRSQDGLMMRINAAKLDDPRRPAGQVS